MYIEGTGFYTFKECHKTESLRNHTTTAHKEREQLGDRRNAGENSCNSGDGTGQMAQHLMFMMMIFIWTLFLQIGSAMAQAVSSRSVNKPCGIRVAQCGSKIGVAFGTCFGFPLSVSHHQCSILICTFVLSITRTSGRNVATLRHSQSLPKAGERLLEKYFHVFWL
jgi:hypothetical protein